MADLNTTRRGLLGAMAVAPMAAMVSAPVFASPASSIEAEFNRVTAWERRLNAGDYPTADWDAWADALTAVLCRIEALPNTTENARLRAKAVVNIYGGDVVLEDSDTTDYRLARQIIFALAGDA